MSPWRHSGQQSYIQCAYEEMNSFLDTKSLYPLSYSTYILGLAAFLSKDCLSLFHALIRSKLNYAAPAWEPWLSATNISSLDYLQNCALRLVIGQLLSTTLEALHQKADVQSYNTYSNWLILRAQEKALWSSGDHPKCLALTANILQHFLNCCSFCNKANNLSKLLPAELENCQLIFQPLFRELLVRLMTLLQKANTT